MFKLSNPAGIQLLIVALLAAVQKAAIYCADRPCRIRQNFRQFTVLFNPDDLTLLIKDELHALSTIHFVFVVVVFAGYGFGVTCRTQN